MTNAETGFFLAYTGAPLSKTAEDDGDAPTFRDKIEERVGDAKEWGKGVYDDARDAWISTPKGIQGAGDWSPELAKRRWADFGTGLAGAGIGGATGLGLSSLYGKIFDKPSLRRDIFGLVLGTGLGGAAGWHGRQGYNAWKNFRVNRNIRDILFGQGGEAPPPSEAEPTK